MRVALRLKLSQFPKMRNIIPYGVFDKNLPSPVRVQLEWLQNRIEENPPVMMRTTVRRVNQDENQVMVSVVNAPVIAERIADALDDANWTVERLLLADLLVEIDSPLGNIDEWGDVPFVTREELEQYELLKHRAKSGDQSMIRLRDQAATTIADKALNMCLTGNRKYASCLHEIRVYWSVSVRLCEEARNFDNLANTGALIRLAIREKDALACVVADLVGNVSAETIGGN